MTGCRFENISMQQMVKDADFFLPPEWFADHGRTDPDTLYRLISIMQDRVRIPVRATFGSAGYDIVTPVPIRVVPGEPVLVPTGLRCVMPTGMFLMIVPRSGLGFKYGVRLLNTCGIIDSDYSYAENEGHILLKMVADKVVMIDAGERIAQAIFLPYAITEDDHATDERHGGFGSTGRT